MSIRALAENYVLEVVARSQSTEQRSERLLAQDYISDTPLTLARAISRSSVFLRKAVLQIHQRIDWHDNETVEDDLRLIRAADQIIRILYSHLRYVEGAQTSRMPWSIVSAFERLVRRLVPTVDIMLRPMWRYNYSTMMVDLRAAYLEALEEFQDYVPGEPIDSAVLTDLARPFHIVAFPALERSNILLHCLLGHEVGHLFAADWLTQERRTQFVKDVLPDIETLADRQLDDANPQVPPLFRPQLREQLIARLAARASTIWTRALEELISDVAGSVVFGPPVLFTTADMGVALRWDDLPTDENDFYPPWRMRLRTVLGTLERHLGGPSGSFFPVPDDAYPTTTPDRSRSVNEYLEAIRRLAEDDADLVGIGLDQLTKVCYDRVPKALEEATIHLVELCGVAGTAVAARTLYPQMPALIRRLDEGIPPNAISESTTSMENASMVAIINAAWFQRLASQKPISGDGEFSSEALRARRVRNALTLKAIEFSELTQDWTDASEGQH